ncbi:MAG TPA: DUF1361 domain-containing protein [Patescibacteria group bacterium]
MGLILFNASWMIYNISLAVIGIFFGFLMLKVKPLFLKTIFGLIWLLFIPNSIYMLTDIIHLYRDLMKVTFFYQVLLTTEYFLLMIIAIITFILSLIFLELTLQQKKFRKYITGSTKSVLFFILNFVVAFGLVLGRMQRLNSWDIVTNLPNVYKNAIHVLTNFQLLMLTLFFGFLCNIVYFSYHYFIKKFSK